LVIGDGLLVSQWLMGVSPMSHWRTRRVIDKSFSLITNSHYQNYSKTGDQISVIATSQPGNKSGSFQILPSFKITV
jgi:hypothetical protein